MEQCSGYIKRMVTANPNYVNSSDGVSNNELIEQFINKLAEEKRYAGDKYYKEKKYELALEMYRMSKKLNPNQKYVDKKIKEIAKKWQPFGLKKLSVKILNKQKTVTCYVLREWIPYNNPNGLGLEILLLEDYLNEEQIISFLKNLGEGKDPVFIYIWTDRIAYEKQKKGKTTERHFILVYFKRWDTQTHLIRWFQEKGKFSHLNGKEIKLNWY